MISILIIGTILTALATSMTYSIKNTSEAQYRDTATALASEPIEVLRHQRATTNWQTFHAALSAKAGSKCITSATFSSASDLTNTLPLGTCTPASVGTPPIDFQRKVTIVANANDITVTSVVSWSRNGTITSDVTLEQTFHNTQPR